MRETAAGKSLRLRPAKAQSPSRNRWPPPATSILRRNLSYYDYNEIKWAKTVHYLLENYLTAANIRTKDVLLCSKERELLRSYHALQQAFLKVPTLAAKCPTEPVLFIDSHCHLLMLRKRQHRQLEEARLQRQLNPKNSQKSLPFLLRTNTHQDQQRELTRTDTRKSCVFNFEALIGSSRDFTQKEPTVEEYPARKPNEKHLTNERSQQATRQLPTSPKTNYKKIVNQSRQAAQMPENPYLLEPRKPKKQKKPTKAKKPRPNSKSQRSLISCNSEIEEDAAAFKKHQRPLGSDHQKRPGHRYTRSEDRLK